MPRVVETAIGKAWLFPTVMVTVLTPSAETLGWLD